MLSYGYLFEANLSGVGRELDVALRKAMKGAKHADQRHIGNGLEAMIKNGDLPAERAEQLLHRLEKSHPGQYKKIFNNFANEKPTDFELVGGKPTVTPASDSKFGNLFRAWNKAGKGHVENPYSEQIPGMPRVGKEFNAPAVRGDTSLAAQELSYPAVRDATSPALRHAGPNFRMVGGPKDEILTVRGRDISPERLAELPAGAERLALGSRQGAALGLPEGRIALGSTGGGRAIPLGNGGIGPSGEAIALDGGRQLALAGGPSRLGLPEGRIALGSTGGGRAIPLGNAGAESGATIVMGQPNALPAGASRLALPNGSIALGADSTGRAAIKMGGGSVPGDVIAGRSGTELALRGTTSPTTIDSVGKELVASRGAGLKANNELAIPGRSGNVNFEMRPGGGADDYLTTGYRVIPNPKAIGAGGETGLAVHNAGTAAAGGAGGAGITDLAVRGGANSGALAPIDVPTATINRGGWGGKILAGLGLGGAAAAGTAGTAAYLSRDEEGNPVAPVVDPTLAGAGAGGAGDVPVEALGADGGAGGGFPWGTAAAIGAPAAALAGLGGYYAFKRRQN